MTDLSFGKDNEIRVKKRLERLFGPLEDTGTMDEFDFKNDGFYIELKTRRVTKTKYPTTMVGENKVIKGSSTRWRASGSSSCLTSWTVCVSGS